MKSGIFRKGIYNLATTRKWNVQKVFKLFLRANNFYWTTNTGFNDALCGLKAAAYDLHYKQEDVEHAFAKVGVFCGMLF